MWIVETVLPLELQPPARLYHYTSQSGLVGILGSKKLWSTRIQFLNDSREFVYTLELWNEAIEAARKSLRTENEETVIGGALDALRKGLASTKTIPIHVACFSEDGDSLSQWRGYGRGKGSFSIGFQSEQLVAAAGDQHCFIAPCIYERERQRELVRLFLKNCMDRLLSGEARTDYSKFSRDVIYDFVFLASVLKHPAFKEEREWRIVTDAVGDHHPKMGIRLGNTMPMPYLEFDLVKPGAELDVEIIVGPNLQQGLAVQATKTLIAFYRCGGEAKQSGIPYREL